MKQIAGFTAEHAQRCVLHKGRIVVTAEREYGVEIHDMRPLRDRLNAPIRGRGVVYTFGVTHFGITCKKLDALKKAERVVEMAE